MRPPASEPYEGNELIAPGLSAASAAPSFVRTAFAHGTLYVVGGVVGPAIGLLLFPFFTHVLSPRDYGIIDLVGLAGTLVAVTVALEISQGLGRYFVEAPDPEERRTLASTALIFSVSMYSMAGAVALLLVKPLTSLLLGPGARSSLMVVAVVGMWCSGILYLAQYLLQYQLRPAAFAVVTLVTAVAGAGTSAVLVLGVRIGVMGALAGQAVGCGTGAAVAFGLSPSLYRFRFDFQRLKRMLAYSVPLIPSSVGVFLNAYADRTAIRARLTVADVGVYGAGYRLALVVSIMLLGLQGALSPLVLSRHREAQTRPELARLFRLFCAAALAVFLLVSLFASDVLHLLTRPAYYRGATVVPFVIAASFLGGMYPFAPGLSIAKRTRLFGLVIGLTGAVNLMLAFGLVGPMGIRGPAVGFLVACAAGFAIVMALSQRIYRVPHDWRRLLPRVAAVGGLVALAASVLGEGVSTGSILAKLIFAAVGLGLIAGLLDRAELVGLVRHLRASGQILRRVRRRGLRRRNARPV
jgi:O-antigen/teichoic acid export membrane protein